MSMTKIYQLNYDFIQQNGHFMIISGTDEQFVESDDLARIQVNMLKANEINGLLPVEIEEIDFQVKLYYEITGKKILTHRLREEKFTMQDFYQLLNQIVTTIESSEEYMLIQANYVLNPDFIFVDKGFKSIDLVYLPLVKIEGKPVLKDEFRDLMFNLVGHVEELRGNGVQQLTQYLQDPGFNIKELKSLLTKLHSDIPNVSQFTSGSVQSSGKVQEPVSLKEPVAKVIEKKQVSKPMSPPKPPTIVKNELNNSQIKNSKKQEEPEESAKPKKPSLVVVICLAALALALSWKLYESMPSEMMFYVSVSLSLVIVAVAVYFGFIYEGKEPKQASEITKNKRTNKKKKGNPKQSVKQEELGQVESSGVNHQHNQQASAPVDSATYFQELGNQTTLLSQPNATVLLDEEAPVIANATYLIVNRKGQTEKITITQSPFIIGRNAAAVDYMEDSVGISRTHIEISENENGFFVKDLGSKNGTKQNGQPLVAYKNYPLNDGDHILIGKVEYTFQKG